MARGQQPWINMKIIHQESSKNKIIVVNSPNESLESKHITVFVFDKSDKRINSFCDKLTGYSFSFIGTDPTVMNLDKFIRRCVSKFIHMMFKHAKTIQKIVSVDYNMNINNLISQRRQKLKRIAAQNKFKKEFLEFIEIGKKNIKFLNGVYHFQLRNQKHEWLFDINYDPKRLHFWFSYWRVYHYFLSKYHLDGHEQQELIKNILKSEFKLDDETHFSIAIA